MATVKLTLNNAPQTTQMGTTHATHRAATSVRNSQNDGKMFGGSLWQPMTIHLHTDWTQCWEFMFITSGQQ